MLKKSKRVEELIVAEIAESESIPAPRLFAETEVFWRAASAVILLAATIWRFYDIPLKPFHHDEGVNGFFLINLVRNGTFQYDPQNYHGPTLYFFTQAATYLVGLNDYAARGVTAFFGVLIVLLVLSLRRYLGTIGALAAASFVALSPGMVYISRYFIHEILFVFFTFGAVVAVVKFVERTRAGHAAIGVTSLMLLVCLLPGTLNFSGYVGGGNAETRIIALLGCFFFEIVLVFLLMRALLEWNAGRFIYLILAAASIVLTFATKETAFISFGTMLIAVACIVVWRKIYRNKSAEKNLVWRESPELNFANFRGALADQTSVIIIGSLCLITFLYLGALFFSSFFTYQEGIAGAFKAYDFWTKTGNKDHTQNGNLAYLKWLFKLESAMLVLGAIGALIAFWRGKHNFGMFCALWAWGILAAYTIIPYKTPWLCVNFILPLALISGYAINELATGREAWQRVLAGVFAAAAIVGGSIQSFDLNFRNYDDNSQPYIYAHTTRETFDLIREIELVANNSGAGKEATIIVASPDYWSLPWYLREYKNALFYGQIVPHQTAEMVIGSTAQAEEIEAEYGRYYFFAGQFQLRPGVDLMLYVRQDLGGENVPALEVR